VRVLILGGGGMIGHQLWRYLPSRFPETYTTIRHNRTDYRSHGLFEHDNVIDGIDVSDFSLLAGLLKGVQPDIILNCVGITKRHKGANNAIPSIVLNALFPHKLAMWGAANDAKVIHFSTDCVFDGKLGNYSEDTPPSAQDLYGRTKALGEIADGNVLTLRSSFIGSELYGGTELLAWFLAQSGTVKGFRNAIYSGFTTLEMCRIVERILVEYPHARGLYNISSDPISKFDLLMLIKEKMHLAVEVVSDETFYCDRSLDSTRFRREFNYSPPSWETMIAELSEEYMSNKEQR
jgi:dTDP-4-dehydrorhamnose reductase